MQEFVQKDFAPMVVDPDGAMRSMPKYMASIQPLIQMSAFLYHLKKDRHVHMIHKMHELLCDKMSDRAFKNGVHKLFVSILAALMTQEDLALRMFPILSGLGKTFYTWLVTQKVTYNCRNGDSKVGQYI